MRCAPPAASSASAHPRLSESNFATARTGGAANFYSGVEQSEWKCLQKMLDILEHGGMRTSLRDMEEADAVLVLGKMSPRPPPHRPGPAGR
jgi:NADH dehydrogenase/NADH:ubiquinone oxidoreductase subunit G